MKITETQLKKIIRQELVKEGMFSQKMPDEAKQWYDKIDYYLTRKPPMKAYAADAAQKLLNAIKKMQ